MALSMLCPPSAAAASGIELEEQFPGDPRRNFPEKDRSICLKNSEKQPKYAGKRFFHVFHFPLITDLFLLLFLRFKSSISNQQSKILNSPIRSLFVFFHGTNTGLDPRSTIHNQKSAIKNHHSPFHAFFVPQKRKPYC
jgi:hypothetical protein